MKTGIPTKLGKLQKTDDGKYVWRPLSTNELVAFQVAYDAWVEATNQKRKVLN